MASINFDLLFPFLAFANCKHQVMVFFFADYGNHAGRKGAGVFVPADRRIHEQQLRVPHCLTSRATSATGEEGGRGIFGPD